MSFRRRSFGKLRTVSLSNGRNPAFVAISEILDSGSSPE
jgi:hypothetical protein